VANFNGYFFKRNLIFYVNMGKILFVGYFYKKANTQFHLTILPTHTGYLGCDTDVCIKPTCHLNFCCYWSNKYFTEYGVQLHSL
jgi:hypothetical protein